MFCIAITKKRILTTDNVFQFVQNGLHFSIILDNSFTQLQKISDGYQILECVSLRTNGSNCEHRLDSPLVLFKATLDLKNQTFRICSTKIPGRALYYFNDGDNLYCSTHISCLREFGVKIEENTSVLPEFFVYRYVMPPETLYKGIKKTIFGEELIFRFSSGITSVESCSSFLLNKSPIIEKTDLEYAKDVGNILARSIEALNSSQSQVSILLSGGLDSSILFQLAKSKIHADESFSTSYPFISLDSRGDIEKKYAISAAEALQSKHQHKEFTVNDYLKGFIESIYASEEPVHHLQSVMFFLLFKYGIDAEHSVVINGQGADGVFGLTAHSVIFTYDDSKLIQLLSDTPLFKVIGKLMTKATGRDYSGAIELMNSLKINDINNPNHSIWKVGAYGNKQWILDNVTKNEQLIIRNRLPYVQNNSGSIYDSISLIDILGDISTTISIWEKIAEANNKRIYFPFCNKELIDYSFSMPWNIKLKSPKNILRLVGKACNLPEFIITRRKSGFGVQPKAWALNGGIFDPLIPLCEKIFEKDEITDVQSDVPDKAMIFWNMLNYAIWKRLFIYDEPISVLLNEFEEQIKVA